MDRTVGADVGDGARRARTLRGARSRRRGRFSMVAGAERIMLVCGNNDGD